MNMASIHPAFESVRTAQIPSLNITLEEYRHKRTGARHIHLAADDENNAFLVAFLTVPKDSTGVAHILEHTSLCSTEKYPVRDPFFMMIRRSLNTFMNAFTSSDWTAYPFASQNAKDFDNLLQVYLDAVFFPRLDPLDFAQEGHRIDFEEPGNPDSPLVYKGVVFNEMKGAMSSPVDTLWHTMCEKLFPTTTYHYNSGGDPANIPDLTHEQLKAFHATHYHPSNALFLTYGDRPVAGHQRYFEECALHRFDKLAVDFSIPDEQRLTAPVNHEASYALDGEDNLSGKTHVVLNWLLGCGADAYEIMRTRLLSGLLYNDSASPLLYALETSDLGASPSPLCGLSASSREMVFGAGLEGSEPQHADAVEKLVLETLNKVAEEGIPLERVESVLHQIELRQREVTGDGYPYGLQLMLRALSPTLHGGDPLNALDIDEVLTQLRKDIQQPDFVKNLVKELLLDNPHRVRMVMTPDPTLSKQKADAEAARLAAIKDTLSDEDKQQVIELAATLEARQNAEEDPEILPKVTLEDVPADMKIAEGQSTQINGSPATWFAQGTNGMVYQQVVVDLPALDDELTGLLPLYCDCLTEMGVGDKSYLETQAWQSAFTGGIGARTSIRSRVDDFQQNQSFFVMSGRALRRNHAALSEILYATFDDVKFDAHSRLRELISQMRTDAENSITGRGHGYAMSAASSRIAPLGALSLRWSGLASIQNIKALDDALKGSEAALAGFADKLAQIHEIIKQAPRQFLLIGEEDAQADISQAVTAQWQHAPTAAGGFQPFKLPAPEAGLVRQAWQTSTQVNFCAKAYTAVPSSHADTPAFMVLGGFLRNGFLHRAIREQGGAYGSGAGYDADSGAFRFFSYRDPRLEGTLEDFDKSISWLLEKEHPARELEEAILGVISGIDQPGSPAGEARSAFFSNLHGRTPEKRRDLRARILDVTLDDLRRVGETYLKPANANIAVISDAATLEKKAEALGLEIRKV